MIAISMSTFPLNMIVFSSFSFSLFNVFSIIYYFSLAVVKLLSSPLLYISTSSLHLYLTLPFPVHPSLRLSCNVLFCFVLFASYCIRIRMIIIMIIINYYCCCTVIIIIIMAFLDNKYICTMNIIIFV